MAPPLERTTAETKANITSMVYSLNSRPTEIVWLNAKYRYYDYDNKTALFEADQLVGDWALGTAIWENEPSSMKRHNLDLDASIAASRYLSASTRASRARRATARIASSRRPTTIRSGSRSTAPATST